MTASSTMQLNRAFAFLCLVISVGAQRNHRLTCYLDVLTHRTCEDLCTHIILPSISSDEDLFHQSLSEDDCNSLKKMKERNPTLKILLGLEVKSSRLEVMADTGGAENFIQTVLTYLKDKSLDGLDMNWLDGPTSDVSTRRKELFTNFLKNLKGTFEKETDPPLLSVSVPEPTDHRAVSYDERTLSQYVDFISILPARLEMDEPYINKTVQHWQDQQVDPEKLNLIMPGFIRRSHRRHHHHRHHPKHDEMNSEEGKKDHISVLGLYMGIQVCQAIKSGQEFMTSTILSDEDSLVKEVVQKGFGGIGVVSIDLDVFLNEVCANITQDERAVVESKAIRRSHHGRGDHHHGGYRHHSGHRSSHLPHDVGQHHRGHGGHHHGRHHHHHHHPNPNPIQ